MIPRSRGAEEVRRLRTSSEVQALSATRTPDAGTKWPTEHAARKTRAGDQGRHPWCLAVRGRESIGPGPSSAHALRNFVDDATIRLISSPGRVVALVHRLLW